jgi:predicted DNA-binding transcriptional regulator AlpA
MTKRVAIIPPADRLGLSRTESADYIGVSPSLFDEMVKDGRMPMPKRINGRTVWDRRRLESAFSALPGDETCAQTELECDPYADVAL